jgi:hypothetical protein
MIKRTKEQRQNEVKTIIKKLNELHLTTTYDGIKTLFQSLKNYTNNDNTNNDNDNTNSDEPIIINIPCPELNIRITGVLEIDLRKRVWVKLESLDYNSLENLTKTKCK